MEKIENKSIKLNESTIKKIWLIADILELTQGEVIAEAIENFYNLAMSRGEKITIAKEILKENGIKNIKIRPIIRTLNKNYNLRGAIDKEDIQKIVKNYIDDFKKVTNK